MIMKKCPRCKNIYDEVSAVSRRDNKTQICPQCGHEEAMFDYFMVYRENDAMKAVIEAEKMWLSSIDYKGGVKNGTI